jgi:dihydrofolate reductase
VAKRRIIVHIGTSADGFIARPGGDLEWLTNRPVPKGFYGMNAFMTSVDAKLLGRKTYETSLKLGAQFNDGSQYYVFSRRRARGKVPASVQFVSEPIGVFAARLRAQKGKDIWMMGGGSLIGSFLDAGAIDDFIITVVPVFIGEGIPLIARRHRHVPLRLVSSTPFQDGVVQLHYRVAQRT